MTQKLVPLKLILSQVTEIQLESMLQTLDRLHDASVAGDLQTTCMMDAPALIGWLEDLIYTAQETIAELQDGMVENEVEAEDLSNVANVRMIRQG